MEKHFCVCRVLATKPYRLDYVVFQESELTRRHDVEVVSKGFATEAAAKAAIIQLGGAIPEGHAMFLDFWERILKRSGTGKMSALWARLKHLSQNRRRWTLGTTVN
jgi:hypothetical protein